MNRLKYQRKTIPIIFDQNDDVWFSAKEVTLALGYPNNKTSFRSAIRRNIPVKYRKEFHKFYSNTNEYHPRKLFISEPGLYRLMLHSRMAKAEKFAEWVTEEVLPSIRKYGKYKLIKEQSITNAELMQQINFLQDEKKQLRKDQIKEKFPNGGIVYVINYSTKYENIYRLGMTSDMKLRKKIYNTHTLHNNEVVHIVKHDFPLQLETCVRAMLYKYKFQPKKDFYECSLNTIKKALSVCVKNIADMKKQKGGSKTNKKCKYTNIIEKLICDAWKEYEKNQRKIDTMTKKLELELKKIKKSRSKTNKKPKSAKSRTKTTKFKPMSKSAKSKPRITKSKAKR